MMAKEISISASRKVYDALANGTQTEVYLNITRTWVKRLVTAEGHKAFCLNLLKDNAYTNGVLGAWASGFKEKVGTIAVRLSFGSEKAVYEVRRISITTGRAAWGAEMGRLYFVVHIGKVKSVTDLGI